VPDGHDHLSPCMARRPSRSLRTSWSSGGRHQGDVRRQGAASIGPASTGPI
jgi:hypothetical protein